MMARRRPRASVLRWGGDGLGDSGFVAAAKCRACDGSGRVAGGGDGAWHVQVKCRDTNYEDACRIPDGPVARAEAAGKARACTRDREAMVRVIGPDGRIYSLEDA
jgi:hypothetical protein